MADFNNAVMTNGGAALLAATTAGTAKIKFTKLVTCLLYTSDAADD